MMRRLHGKFERVRHAWRTGHGRFVAQLLSNGERAEYCDTCGWRVP